MARLLTAGCEIEPKELGLSTIGLVTQDVTVFRSGLASWKCNTGAGDTQAYTFTNSFVRAASTTYYHRVYFIFFALPTSNIIIQRLGNLRVHLTTAGKLQLINQSTGTQIGSDSTDTIVADGVKSYRIELQEIMNASTQTSGGELRLDGITVATASGLTIATTAPIDWGWEYFSVNTTGANKVLNTDDVALNDSTGTDQNSWPGEGKIVLLKPVTDNAGGTGWTLGTGTALGGAGHTAVANTPPLGVADLAAGSDVKQIRNATSNANVNYDANMTDFATAGLGQIDTISVVDPIVATSAPVVTSAKAGTVGVVSNPTIANIALGAGGTAGAFWSGVAGGTYPTGWKISHGTITYNPAVTINMAPVMRITQVTASTRIAVVCFMGMYVEYVPHNRPGWFVRSDARHRSHNW